MILGGVADPDTLDRLSQPCGEIALRAHSRTRAEDGRRAHTVTYQPVRVLPPELLRTLPEWRALILRTNLSPVVVRLRMAWRRHDYARARRFGPFQPGSLPVAATALPQPQRPGPDIEGELDAGPDGHASLDPGKSDLQPATPDEPTAPRTSPGPFPVPRWMIPPDAAPSAPSSGEHQPPRPRRPWDPPVDSEDRK